jgi:hypothetical protein
MKLPHPKLLDFNPADLQVLAYLRVVHMLAVSGGFPVDVEGPLSDLLLRIQGFGQGLQLVELHRVVLAFYWLLGTALSEVHLITWWWRKSG